MEKLIAIVCVVAMFFVCHYAEVYALQRLVKSAQSIKWIDRAARLAFLFSDLCLVALAALVAYSLAVMCDLHFVFSVVSVSG